MKTSTYAILLLTLLAAPAAASASCPAVRLDDPGRSMSQLTVRNQNNIPICWAFTAAQMLDAYRNSHSSTAPSSFQSSAIELAEATLGIRNTQKGMQRALQYGVASGTCASEQDSRKPSCSQRVAVGPARIVKLPGGKRLKAAIQARLSGSQPIQPIGISYNVDVLKHGRQGLKPSERLNFHVSVIIGQRPAGPSGCQFLVRNTWGSACHPKYSKDWECEAGKGQVWVDADALIDSIAGPVLTLE